MAAPRNKALFTGERWPIWRHELLGEAQSIGESFDKIAETFTVSEFGSEVRADYEFRAYGHVFSVSVHPELKEDPIGSVRERATDVDDSSYRSSQ